MNKAPGHSWRLKARLIMSQTHLSNFGLTVGKLTVLLLDCDATALLIIQDKWPRKKKISHGKWLTFIYGGKMKSGRGKNEDEPLNSLHIHVLIHSCFWKASSWATMATLQQALFIWKCKLNTHYYWGWWNKDGSMCSTHFCWHLIRVLGSRERKPDWKKPWKPFILLVNQI